MNRFSLAALASGALFGAGLAMAGMTDPRRVLGFLDVAGNFDPSLIFVLGGAVATTLMLFRLVLRRDRPVLAGAFQLSSLKQIDSKLLVGAAFMFDLRLLGLARGLPVSGLATHLLRWSRLSLWLVIPSGLLMFTAHATEMAVNPAFRLKLVLIAAPIAGPLTRRVRRPPALQWAAPGARPRRGAPASRATRDVGGTPRR